jgi:hypothetical protein
VLIAVPTILVLIVIHFIVRSTATHHKVEILTLLNHKNKPNDVATGEGKALEMDIVTSSKIDNDTHCFDEPLHLPQCSDLIKANSRVEGKLVMNRRQSLQLGFKLLEQGQESLEHIKCSPFIRPLEIFDEIGSSNSNSAPVETGSELHENAIPIIFSANLNCVQEVSVEKTVLFEKNSKSDSQQTVAKSNPVCQQSSDSMEKSVEHVHNHPSRDQERLSDDSDDSDDSYESVDFSDISNYDLSTTDDEDGECTS